MSAIAHAICIPPLLALVISASLVATVIHTKIAVFALDRPNQRSLHATPMPRLGGIGIIAGIGAAWFYIGALTEPLLLTAVALLVVVSLCDDLHGINVGWRLAVHVVSATLGVVAVLNTQSSWGVLVAILATAWMINLYNFMDGSDGLAGGMTAIGFGTYGAAALVGGDFSLAALSLSVAAAALGFLLFNFPPARVFMGDVGAIPLGLLAAILNLAGTQRGDWPVWFGVVVFSPFIVDASVTLGKRLVRRARVWQAHREHYYQRLIQSGWGHRKTALAEYALMLVCSGGAVAGLRLEATGQIAIVVGVTVAYLALIFALERTLPQVV